MGYGVKILSSSFPRDGAEAVTTLSTTARSKRIREHETTDRNGSSVPVILQVCIMLIIIVLRRIGVVVRRVCACAVWVERVVAVRSRVDCLRVVGHAV